MSSTTTRIPLDGTECHSALPSGLYVTLTLFWHEFYSQACNCVYQGEPFADTKKRIQERLNVSDKDFAKFKFALIQSHVFKQPTNLNDGKRTCFTDSSFAHRLSSCSFSQRMFCSITSSSRRTYSVSITWTRAQEGPILPKGLL